MKLFELKDNPLMEILNEEGVISSWIEDLSYDEISDILKCSVGTVSTFVARAKKKFRTIADELNIT